MTAEQTQVIIEVLPSQWPKKAELEVCALKFRQIRLQALQQDPGAYGASYDIEVGFPPLVWQQRLQIPETRHIVASLGTGGDHRAIERHSTWVGFIVVVQKQSPATENPASSSREGQTIRTEGANLTLEDTAIGLPDVNVPAFFYDIAGTYVRPSLRICGLGKMLMQAALEHIRSSARSLGMVSARTEVAIFSDNEPAKALYLKSGFRVIVGEDCGAVAAERRTVHLSRILDLGSPQN